MDLKPRRSAADPTAACWHAPIMVPAGTADSSAELAVVLACARARPTEQTLRQIRELTDQPPDWEHVVRIAEAHGVWQLVIANATAAAARIPEPVARNLQGRLVETTGLNLSLAVQLARLLRLLDAHGIPSVAVKGPVLAASAYGNVGLRSFGDLDVLVSRDAIDSVRQVMLANGYRLADRYAILGGVCPAAGREEAFEPNGRGATVEIQVAVSTWRLPVRLEPSDLIRRAVSVEVAGTRMRTLSPEDQLLTLAAHGTRHLWSLLRFIADIDAATRVNLDWSIAVERARDAHMTRMLFVALLLAHQLLGTTMPAEVLALATRDRAARRLASQLSGRLFDKGRPLFAHLWIDWVSIQSRERLADKLRYGLRLVAFERIIRPLDESKRPRARRTAWLFARIAHRLTLPVTVVAWYVWRPTGRTLIASASIALMAALWSAWPAAAGRLTRSVARAAYSGVAGGVVWLALAPLAGLQVALGRASRGDLRELMGLSTVAPARTRPRILVHAVSAGEMSAAGAFIETLARERPRWSVVLTCGTRDGRTVAEILQKRLSCIESVTFLPWDRRSAVWAWLDAIRPDACVVVEPEIWPNLYFACARLRIPLMLIHAHVYPRDVRRYRFVRWFMRDVLDVPLWIAAQTAADRDALVKIGAPPATVVVLGSLKFDAAGYARRADGHQPFPSWNGTGPVIVGGSTHHPEEDWLFDALARLRSRFVGLQLVVAPRHLSRVPVVVRSARSRGLRVARVSESAAPSAWDVLVLDRIGDLSSFYASADVAVVGGTLAQRGGHNVLEPASHGCAIVVGPHVGHIRDLVDGLQAEGGIVRLAEMTSSSLVDALARLLADEDARRELGERARRYHAAGCGAARRCADAVIAEVERRLGPAGVPGQLQDHPESSQLRASGAPISGRFTVSV